MVNAEILTNLALLGGCYAYILLTIFLTGKINKRISKKTSRKFLHMMIGNFSFIIPFFTFNVFPLNFPFFVAAPFVLVTFLVSPYSPVKSLGSRMTGLVEVTEEGHQLGLFFYAISYTILAALFSAKPMVIAAGILPMAYGDAAASIVGEKFGKCQYRIFARKSLEGSFAMFAASLAIFGLSLLFFSALYSFTFNYALFVALAVATVASIAEALTPKGFDNVTVPLFSAFTFLLLFGGA